MATTKTSKRKPAKKATKRSARKTTAVRRKKISSTDVMLPPKKREKVIKMLRKMSLPVTHPSSVTGPALTLDYDAPLENEKPKKTRTKSAKKGK